MPARTKKRKAVNLPQRNSSGGAAVVSSNWKALEKDLGRAGKKRKVVPGNTGGNGPNDEADAVDGEKELWFGEDVDEGDLERGDRTGKDTGKGGKDKDNAKDKVEVVLKRVTSDKQLITGQNHVATKIVALDCEMVGTGRDGKSSILARVSIVNRYGHVLYDSHVRPKEKVTDYRTFVSGVVAKDIKNAPELEKVQQDVSDLLLGKTLVGHALKNDFKVLMLNHPKRMIRDSARYKPFRKFAGGRTPGLKKLCAQLLGLEIQEGAHSSVIDAQATMLLYIKFKKEWEEKLSNRSAGIVLARDRPEGFKKAAKPMRDRDRVRKASDAKVKATKPQHESKNLFNTSKK